MIVTYPILSLQRCASARGHLSSIVQLHNCKLLQCIYYVQVCHVGNFPDWLLCNAAHGRPLETSRCTATSAEAALAAVTSQNPLDMMQRPPSNAAMMQPMTKKICEEQSLTLLRFGLILQVCTWRYSAGSADHMILAVRESQAL